MRPPTKTARPKAKKTAKTSKKPKKSANVLDGIDAEQFKKDYYKLSLRQMLDKYAIARRRYYAILTELEIGVDLVKRKKERVETIITVQATEQAQVIQNGYLNFIAGANLAVTETLENIQELKRLIKVFESKVTEDDPELFDAAKMVVTMRTSLDYSINTLTKIMKFGKEIDETAQIIQAYQNVYKIILGVISRYDPEIRELIMRELYDKYRMTLPNSIQEQKP